jgi:acyl-CoA thioesterase
MDRIKKFFQQHDQFAKSVGIELLDVKEGYARARMALRREHLNGVATGHGGIIFTLADFVFAAAVNSHGTIAVAINANISYIKAVSEGDILTAEATETALHPKLAVCAVTVTDQMGAVVASFQGTAYRKNRNLLPEAKQNADPTD